jgi:hypothetical protein
MFILCSLGAVDSLPVFGGNANRAKPKTVERWGRPDPAGTPLQAFFVPRTKPDVKCNETTASKRE